MLLLFLTLNYQVILCTKEVAVKARSSAFTLLIECCNASFRSSGKTRQGESLAVFVFQLVIAIASLVTILNTQLPLQYGFLHNLQYNTDTFVLMCCVYLGRTDWIICDTHPCCFCCFTHNLFAPSLDVLECLTSFLELVVAGIAGSPHMISATIISVSRVVYEFRSEYSTKINNSEIMWVLCFVIAWCDSYI